MTQQARHVDPVPTVAGGRDAGSVRTRELLSRADAELVAAQFSPEAWEQFTHAHLAALRAGAAVVSAKGRPAGRRALRTVWEMLDVVAPELSRWSAYFADGAALRSAVDAGRFDAVSRERAEETVCAAEDFVDAARDVVRHVGLPARGEPVLAARAS